MPWKRFVESKNNLFKTDKVFKWDDSADMYINDIDWNSEIDSKLFLEIKSISDDEEEEEEVKRIDSFSIPLEQIKATRWEYDEPISRLPTIVGS
ncbi:hypothetical protein Gotur_027887 [Gossypium turneri]